jgi:hypothetical protein
MQNRWENHTFLARNRRLNQGKRLLVKGERKKDLVATNREKSYGCNKGHNNKTKVRKACKRIEKLVDRKHEKPLASNKNSLHGFVLK